jgi:hypothetical protein
MGEGLAKQAKTLTSVCRRKGNRRRHGRCPEDRPWLPLSVPTCILEVVALLGGEIDRACLGKLVEPGMVLRRQLVVAEVVESEAPYGTAPARLAQKGNQVEGSPSRTAD